jgi:hypothetical protein
MVGVGKGLRGGGSRGGDGAFFFDAEKRETRNGNEWKLDRIKPNGEKKTAWGLSGSFFWGGFLWASLFLPCVHLRIHPPIHISIQYPACTVRTYGNGAMEVMEVMDQSRYLDNTVGKGIGALGYSDSKTPEVEVPRGRRKDRKKPSYIFRGI